MYPISPYERHVYKSQNLTMKIVSLFICIKKNIKSLVIVLGV